jgi:hypothetical protein
MVRWLTGILGAGLVVLALCEINVNAIPWVTGFDVVAAVFALVMAKGLHARSPHSARIGGPIAIAVGLFAFSLISHATNGAPSWQINWNVAFACGFLFTGLGAAISASDYLSQMSPFGIPYAHHSSGAFGAGYPYSWEPFGLMGGYDRSVKQTGHAGVGPRNYKRSDARIEEDVNDRLTDSSALDASDIKVQVKNREVWLEGHVDNRHTKRLAEEIADSVSGVNDVKNELQIKRKVTSSVVKVA